jgi:hypothetical protein
MYDIIGDIHGYASVLKRLLLKLGYVVKDGEWQHPQHKVIFLGDFVDRGPEQVEVIEIVKRMVEAGHALAVMGNHEFNAVAWATADEAKPGEFLRIHSSKNRHQHAAFLHQIGEDSIAHREAIAWFKTLPLFIDFENLRVVHACWHPAQIDALRAHIDEYNRIKNEAWPQLCSEGSEPFEALETILKGMEIALPLGVEFRDKDGHVRRRTRTLWWHAKEGLTYRELAMVPAELIAQIPHDPVPQELQPGYDGLKPLFIGHYWMSGVPKLISEHIVCLDWSVAGSDATKAKLCAYRWSGESELCADHLVWVVR